MRVLTEALPAARHTLTPPCCDHRTLLVGFECSGCVRSGWEKGDDKGENKCVRSIKLSFVRRPNLTLPITLPQTFLVLVLAAAALARPDYAYDAPTSPPDLYGVPAYPTTPSSLYGAPAHPTTPSNLYDTPAHSATQSPLHRTPSRSSSSFNPAALSSSSLGASSLPSSSSNTGLSRRFRPSLPSSSSTGLSRASRPSRPSSSSSSSSQDAGYSYNSPSDTGYSYSEPRQTPAQYDTQYVVSDAEFGTNFGQQERRDGDDVSGTYYVQLPDGRLQVVTYTVSAETGYVAEVTYEGQTTTAAPSYTAPASTYGQPSSAYGVPSSDYGVPSSG
ncbi:hypothetical protein O3P69_014753 [Scylla paramamosain]|uniref:Pro-resilin n=1 Tax=Scylla paramamosain TaxID=85552 RepID=A0AAW0U0Y3_SCYPA